jgi:lipoic acid synthetase
MPANIPDWIRPRDFDRTAYEKTLNTIREHALNTVCMEANCPNRYECFSHGTATFMILGNICTRNCLYCNVRSGRPEPVDKEEPGRIADAVKKLGIKHAVITCVTRDDLEDGGASHFADVVESIKKENNCTIELLISDLNGSRKALETIVRAGPDIINHNIEVVSRLFPKLRPKGSYRRSTELLERIKRINPGMTTKSGLMVGLGETMEEVFETLQDLRKAGCDIVTAGQYLRPTPRHAPVKKYYTPQQFKKIKQEALSLGFRHAEAGPLVRSSYHASKALEAA